MRLSKLTSPTPIGLDLGARWIKAVQLAPGGSTGPAWRVVAAARVLRRGPELDARETSRIESILHRRGFSGSRVVLAAPADRLMSAELTLPPAASGAPLDQIARAELARVSRKDPASMEIGWWPVPPPGGSKPAESTHAMAVSCARAEIEQTLATFESLGLEVIAVDTPAWALTRGVSALLSAESFRPELCAVLDMGWSRASLTIIRDAVPVYERTLPDLGVQSIDAELRKTLQFNDEVCAHLIERVGVPGAAGVTSMTKGSADPWSQEPGEGSRRVADYLHRVAAEVKASLSYLAHRYPAWPVDVMMCTGGGALIPGAAAVLSADLHVPARVASPAGIAAAPADESLADVLAHPAMMQTAGLAMYGRVQSHASQERAA